MERFVRQTNIAHFTAQIKAETDPTKLRILRKLLAEEEAKAVPTGVKKDPSLSLAISAARAQPSRRGCIRRTGT